jgi:hypothetical protein
MSSYTDDHEYRVNICKRRDCQPHIQHGAHKVPLLDHIIFYRSTLRVYTLFEYPITTSLNTTYYKAARDGALANAV